MEYQKCPICNGNGLVSDGFYSHAGDQMSWPATSNTPEPCRACQGTGLLVKPEMAPQTEYQPKQFGNPSTTG